VWLPPPIRRPAGSPPATPVHRTGGRALRVAGRRYRVMTAARRGGCRWGRPAGPMRSGGPSRTLGRNSGQGPRRPSCAKYFDRMMDLDMAVAGRFDHLVRAGLAAVRRVPGNAAGPRAPRSPRLCGRSWTACPWRGERIPGAARSASATAVALAGPATRRPCPADRRCGHLCGAPGPPARPGMGRIPASAPSGAAAGGDPMEAGSWVRAPLIPRRAAAGSK
jgi:hypothetical protein